jgi:DNA polymerase-3 subunit delta
MPAVAKNKEKEKIPQADIYVIQGDDDLAVSDTVRELKERHSADGFGEMNFQRLDGQSVSKSEFAAQVNALPMLGSRLVVLNDALALLKGKEDIAWLGSLLTAMPSTTAVVLLIKDSKKFSRGSLAWQAVGSGHALRKSLSGLNRSSAWLECPKPTQREMPEWIANQAVEMKLALDSRAAVELANLVGDDQYLARQELIKAKTYAGEGEPITRDMVRLLCSPSREEDVFAMVDAAGQRNPGKALSLLNALLRDQPVQFVFSMVARQFRLLIIAKEIMQEGGDEGAIAAEGNLHAFVAKKLAVQAPRFSMAELLEIYRQLDRMDERAKTGDATLEVMLETMIADLSG